MIRALNFIAGAGCNVVGWVYLANGEPVIALALFSLALANIGAYFNP